MQPFKTENRKSRLNPCVKVLGRLIVGFSILKRIQENQKGSIEQKCKKWLEGGRKSLAERELSNSVYLAFQKDG